MEKINTNNYHLENFVAMHYYGTCIIVTLENKYMHTDKPEHHDVIKQY